MTAVGDPSDPINLLIPNIELLKGTIGNVISEKLKDFSSTLTEPTQVGKDIARELHDLNAIMRQVNVSLTTLAERLK